ncbi:MAG TPA: hypothetical protein VGH19_12020 [Verrucomicrobiae bacterium]
MPRILLLLLFFLPRLLLAQTEPSKVVAGKLIEREFKVNVAAVIRNIEQVIGVVKEGSKTNAQEMLVQLFTAAGVDLSPKGGAGKLVVLDEKAGVLRVKATGDDLEVIAGALEILEIDPVQVLFEVRHIEIEENYAKEEELKLFFKALTPVAEVGWRDSWLKVPSITATNVTVEGLFRPGYSRILSEGQTKIMIKKLELHDGVSLIAFPRVTGITNRPVQVGSRINHAKGTISHLEYYPGRVEDHVLRAGVMTELDARVVMQPDRKSITVDWIAGVTQVLGFQTVSASIATGNKANAPVPNFRVWHVTDSTQMKDGETLMVGCGRSDSITPGRMGGPNQTNKVVTILMLTPRLMDAEGKPINGK